MRPAMEYAPFVWSPIASSTSINKLQVIQNAALRTATGSHKTQTYNICMTKHSHSPYTSTYSPTPHNTNRKHNIHHIPYTTYFNTPRLKKTLFLTTAATQQTFPHSDYNRHKHKHASYTYIYCL